MEICLFLKKLRQFPTDSIQGSVRFALIPWPQNCDGTIPRLNFSHDQQLLKCDVKTILFHLARPYSGDNTILVLSGLDLG